MDRFEYEIRAKEIVSLYKQGEYQKAVKIVDTIDWRRVKGLTMLCRVSEIYRYCRRYEEARDILLMANEISPNTRRVVYALCELSIILEDTLQMLEYYRQYINIAPHEADRYILQYKVLESQDVSLEERIAVLEKYKNKNYDDPNPKWTYELAYLYHRIGLETQCVEECDELILWFGDGKYVYKAMELKMLHAPLTPAQQEKYNARFMEAQEAIALTEMATEEEETSNVEPSLNISLKKVEPSKAKTTRIPTLRYGRKNREEDEDVRIAESREQRRAARAYVEEEEAVEELEEEELIEETEEEAEAVAEAEESEELYEDEEEIYEGEEEEELYEDEEESEEESEQEDISRAPTIDMSGMAEAVTAAEETEEEVIAQEETEEDEDADMKIAPERTYEAEEQIAPVALEEIPVPEEMDDIQVRTIDAGNRFDTMNLEEETTKYLAKEIVKLMEEDDMEAADATRALPMNSIFHDTINSLEPRVINKAIELAEEMNNQRLAEEGKLPASDEQPASEEEAKTQEAEAENTAGEMLSEDDETGDYVEEVAGQEEPAQAQPVETDRKPLEEAEVDEDFVRIDNNEEDAFSPEDTFEAEEEEPLVMAEEEAGSAEEEEDETGEFEELEEIKETASAEEGADTEEDYNQEYYPDQHKAEEEDFEEIEELIEDYDEDAYEVSEEKEEIREEEEDWGDEPAFEPSNPAVAAAVNAAVKAVEAAQVAEETVAEQPVKALEAAVEAAEEPIKQVFDLAHQVSPMGLGAVTARFGTDPTAASAAVEKLVAEEKPVEAQQPAAEEKPVEAQQPVAEEKPAEAQQPVAEEKPVEAQQPVAEEKPAEAQQSVAEEKPAEVQQAAAEEKPVEAQQPVAEEKPAEVQQPVAEVEPAEAQQPVAEEKPAEAEQPATEEKSEQVTESAAEEKAVEEEKPVEAQAPVQTIEQPAAEEKPAEAQQPVAEEKVLEEPADVEEDVILPLEDEPQIAEKPAEAVEQPVTEEKHAVEEKPVVAEESAEAQQPVAEEEPEVEEEQPETAETTEDAEAEAEDAAAEAEEVAEEPEDTAEPEELPEEKAKEEDINPIVFSQSKPLPPEFIEAVQIVAMEAAKEAAKEAAAAAAAAATAATREVAAAVASQAATQAASQAASEAASQAASEAASQAAKEAAAATAEAMKEIQPSKEAEEEHQKAVEADKPMVEKQITGQLSFNDIIAEWENTKKANEEKHIEEMKQRVKEQTGSLFSDFETARSFESEQLNTISPVVDVFKDTEDLEREVQQALIDDEEDQPEEAEETAAPEIEEQPASSADLLSQAEEVKEEVPANEMMQDRQNNFNTAEINGLEDKLMSALDGQHYDTSNLQTEILHSILEKETGLMSQDDGQSQQQEAAPEVQPAPDLASAAAMAAEAAISSAAAKAEAAQEATPAAEPSYTPAAEPAPAPVPEEKEAPASLVAMGLASSAAEAVAMAKANSGWGTSLTPKPPVPAATESLPTAQIQQAAASAAAAQTAVTAAQQSVQTAAVQTTPAPAPQATAEEYRVLTKEEKGCFASAAHGKEMQQSLAALIDQASLYPLSGNIRLIGEVGTEPELVARELVQAYALSHPEYSGKMTAVTGKDLAFKPIDTYLEEYNNGVLIVEQAADLTLELCNRLFAKAQMLTGILMIFCDTKDAMDRLIRTCPKVTEYFPLALEINVLDNNGLVKFALAYANTKEYSIDEMGKLALYNRIEERQRQDHAVSVDEVKYIIDSAIGNAEKKSVGHLMDIVFAKRYDKEDMVVLREKDFEI
ncbi:MAG: hypothetical protein K5739_12645 [Lachnospiraceae bacterium]|nr:hypothetical protein [Lachnospiraceae bacterium]